MDLAKKMDLMNKLLIIFFLIFLFGCSLDTKSGIWDNKTNKERQVSKKNYKNITETNIDPKKSYSFNEYVNVLSNKNKSGNYPNINDFPE